MYNIKFDCYVPKPKAASSDRIVAAHYYAAWKKGAAELHEGFDDLADIYPDRTPLMGYYDEENPEVADWEIKWALEHGINCFIYCWYRRLENMGKPVTTQDLRCGHSIHEALFHAKYGDMMKFAIMFEVSPRWGATDEDDMLRHLMPFWMENYFKRGNYLLIDNQPVLFVYKPTRLSDECFRSAKSQRETFEKCREYARACGFDGMIFAACEHEVDEERHKDFIRRGFDVRFGYNSGYVSEYDYPPEDEVIDAQCALLEQNLAIDNMRFIPTPSCFRDSTPRYSQRWLDLGYTYRLWHKIWYLSPEKYRQLLERMKNMADAPPEGAWGRKMFMIDNWNEWDEGHFVAPSHKFGFQYLQAIREVLTARDNLPDYRSPQDQGFGGYNTSWRTPDFGEFCKRNLEK